MSEPSVGGGRWVDSAVSEAPGRGFARKEGTVRRSNLRCRWCQPRGRYAMCIETIFRVSGRDCIGDGTYGEMLTSRPLSFMMTGLLGV